MSSAGRLVAACTFALMCLGAVGAHRAVAAGPWGKKKTKQEQARRPSARELAVTRGNDHLRSAKSHVQIVGANVRLIVPTVESEREARAAVAAYTKALALPAPGDSDAQLYYRMFLAAEYYGETVDRWTLTVTAFDAFRAADPQDPRETTMLPSLCTALSKLGQQGGADADVYFARGVQEYDVWRSRIDATDPDHAETLGHFYTNTAELLMALGPGRLEEAIRYYQAGIDFYSYESLSWYGLAVAADRDGQWNVAVAAMKEAIDRDNSRNNGQIGQRLYDPGVFFVPEGDKSYYEALRAQVRGDDKLALAKYKEFLVNCTATKFAGRARQHIAELEKKLQTAAAPATTNARKDVKGTKGKGQRRLEGTR